MLGFMTKPSDRSRLVAELRAITAEHAQPRRIIELVRPLMAGLAPTQRGLITATGFTKAGDTCCMKSRIMAWPFSRSRGPRAPRHLLTLTFWTRTDDGNRPGHATLRKDAERSFGPGNVVTLLPDAIHSVVNTTFASTLTIHVYGRNPDHTGRPRFDVNRGLEIPIASSKELVR